MLQWPEEAAWFFELIHTLGVKRVLEIGTGPGGLAQQLARRNISVITVDKPSSGDMTGLTFAASLKRNAALALEHVDVVMGDSHAAETVDAVEALVAENPVDLLFLDGDDTFEGKTRDYALYRPFVRPNGWFATHDISTASTGVPKFWNRLTCPTKHAFSGHDHKWGGIGVWQP